jgi:Mrp family chromosome partitioning ATPase
MIEPINFLGAVRQRWRLIVVLAVVGAVIALVIPGSTAKHTKSVLKWETFASVGAPASNGLIQGTVSNAQILFYSNTFPVKLAAVSDAGLAGNPYIYAGGMFGSTIGPSSKTPYPIVPASVTAPSGKQATGGLVTLYASGPTQVLAAALCNAYAKELGIALDQTVAAHAASTTTPGARGTSNPNSSSNPTSSSTATSTPADGSSFASTSTGYQVVFPGTPELAHRINQPKASTFDGHKLRLVIGVALGALLALVIIVVREVLNKTIRRPGRAAVHFKFPVVSVIPETYPLDPGVVDVVDRPTSPAAEAYRKLRMSVLFEAMAADSSAASGGDAFADMFGMPSSQVEPYKVPEPGARSVLLVVSSVDEPARSKVVANLAATYAEASERVIVVSTGDLEVGTAIPAVSALTGPLTASDIASRLTPAGPENVSMLSMRHFMRNSGQLALRTKEVFDAARQVADVVVVEAPAFLRFHHGEAMVHSVDAVIIVVECGVTSVPDAQDMGDVLRRLGAPVLGVVFAGEVLSKGQRRVLDAGMAASGRTPAGSDADAADAADAADPLNGTEAVGEAHPDVAPELHPS